MTSPLQQLSKNANMTLKPTKSSRIRLGRMRRRHSGIEFNSLTRVWEEILLMTLRTAAYQPTKINLKTSREKGIRSLMRMSIGNLGKKWRKCSTRWTALDTNRTIRVSVSSNSPPTMKAITSKRTRTISTSTKCPPSTL
jgi:hypothetical protein